jgi:ATP-dependent helicase STH1/SNF2
MALLSTILQHLVAQGHKLLLFSTMTTMLDSVEEVLDWLGMQWERLDGATKASDRGTILSTFSTSANASDLFHGLRGFLSLIIKHFCLLCTCAC